MAQRRYEAPVGFFSASRTAATCVPTAATAPSSAASVQPSSRHQYAISSGSSELMRPASSGGTGWEVSGLVVFQWSAQPFGYFAFARFAKSFV